MKITIIAVGKIKEKWINEGVHEFVKRISKFADTEIIEIVDSPDELGTTRALTEEGQKILSKIKDNDFVVSLEIDGDEYDSVMFSGMLIKWLETGGSKLVFVIGGSNGLHDMVKNRSNESISFSKMTFPHKIMRIILLEQIYRGFKIQNNERYHK